MDERDDGGREREGKRQARAGKGSGKGAGEGICGQEEARRGGGSWQRVRWGRGIDSSRGPTPTMAGIETTSHVRCTSCPRSLLVYMIYTVYSPASEPRASRRTS